jgi:hypothetical protein
VGFDGLTAHINRTHTSSPSQTGEHGGRFLHQGILIDLASMRSGLIAGHAYHHVLNSWRCLYHA